MHSVRKLLGAAVVAAAVVGLGACDPPPPRAAFVVTTTSTDGDAVPGDGVCATAAGGCSLRAAVQEGGLAADGADISLPAGRYEGVEVARGDIRVNWGAPQAPVHLTGEISVASGARLALDGINASMPARSDGWSLALSVSGSVEVRRSALAVLQVGAGGRAVLDRSLVAGAGPSRQTSVRGALVAVDSTFLTGADPSVALDSTAGGTTVLQRVVVAEPAMLLTDDETGVEFLYREGGTGTCGGAVTSIGRVHVEVGCGTAGVGDQTGGAELTTILHTQLGRPPYGLDIIEIDVAATSPIVDAVPLGAAGCDGTGVDLFGNPRGVDGDGDGVGGCDIGALERPVPDPG